MATKAAAARGDSDLKRRRRHRRLLIAGLIVLLAYPVLGTVALWTGLVEKILRSEDLIVDIENPAWTLIPGRVHMASVRILANGETQFILEGQHVTFHFKLLELLQKRAHVTNLWADNVRYQMRVQVKTTKGIEERVAAYPPLAGLPGNPTLILAEAQKSEQREGDFTVNVEGIEAKVVELWFMEYRYIGPGTVRGGFLVGPHRMRVSTSVQNLGPGELRFGSDQIIAKNFRGRIQTAIPDINPEEHADESFLELVDTNIYLAGDVVTLKHVSAYLKGLRVIGGAGPFETRLSMSKGRLGIGSRMAFQTEKVGIRGNGFGIDTDWTFNARVATAGAADEKAARTAPATKLPAAKTERRKAAAGSTAKRDFEVLPRLTSTSNATYISFSNRRGDIFTVQALNHAEGATLNSTQLGRMTDIENAYLRFPEIVTNDFKDLGALSGEKTPIESKNGSARASLFLDIDENHVARGPFKAAFDGLRFIAAGIQLNGDGKVGFNMRVDLDHEATTLTDIGVHLSDVGMKVGDEEAKDWWMNLSAKQFAAWGLPPKRLETKFALHAKNAEPVLEALAEKGKFSEIVADLTDLDDLKMTATVRQNGKTTDVMLEPLESEHFDVAGRLHASGDKSQFAFVIGGKAVSIGIANDGSKTSFKPMARSDWLNAKLRDFPKPVEQVLSSQP